MVDKDTNVPGKEYIEREAAIEAAFSSNSLGNTAFSDVNDTVNRLRLIPDADVVEGEAYRELLKAARKMHCWIFLNTADELEAYDECGLTDEMNALLGYGGQFIAKMDGGVNDA